MKKTLLKLEYKFLVATMTQIAQAEMVYQYRELM